MEHEFHCLTGDAAGPASIAGLPWFTDAAVVDGDRHTRSMHTAGRENWKKINCLLA